VNRYFLPIFPADISSIYHPYIIHILSIYQHDIYHAIPYFAPADQSIAKESLINLALASLVEYRKIKISEL